MKVLEFISRDLLKMTLRAQDGFQKLKMFRIWDFRNLTVAPFLNFKIENPFFLVNHLQIAEVDTMNMFS